MRKFKHLRKSKTLRLLRRLLPTLIGLFLIGAFLQTNPDLASQFGQQLLSRFGVTLPTRPAALPDFPIVINNFRQSNRQETLQQTDALDSLAHLLSLSLASSPDNQPQVSLQQAATIVGYRYTAISYLAIIIPPPLELFSLDSWLNDNQEELLRAEYTQIGVDTLLLDTIPRQTAVVVVLARPNSTSATTPAASTTAPTYYTGTELWQAIQKYRIEHGVPPFKQDNTLCTIASIRLNQLLDLGKLDNHAGFEPLVEQFRSDGRLTHTNIAENLLSGYPTPETAVAGWDSSLGHQALLRDGAYVFACAAANAGFAVLIAAF